MFAIDRQTEVALMHYGERYSFTHSGKTHQFSSIESVQEFFLEKSYDTVKISCNGKKSYFHITSDDAKVFDNKKDLRRALSRENGSVWVEKLGDKERYFIDESGWFTASFKQISKEEYLQKQGAPSTLQKVLGVGLGILALVPGISEFARRMPIGTNEVALGLIAMNQRSPALGLLGCSLIPSQVQAQAVGTEFQVNTYIANEQTTPSVSAFDGGGFVVTWTSNGQDGDLGGIYGQRYDADGAQIGAEFQINIYTSVTQRDPSIAILDRGGFVVIWQSFGQDGDGFGIYGQKYAVSGAIDGNEFQVNNYTASFQQAPEVAALTDGGFVVAWASNLQDGSGYGIYGQVYDGNGDALAPAEFRINTVSVGNQRDPSIAALERGGFVAAWVSDGLVEICGQRYDENNNAVGAEFQINNYTAGAQENPAVAPMQRDGFVVAWTSDGQDGDDFGVFSQRFDETGSTLGREFVVNAYRGGSQSNPDIASLNNGGFAVVWESDGQDGNGTGIYGQRYDEDGARIGAEFQVNTYTTSAQCCPSIASLSSGGFVVIWESDGQDGDGSGIYGQRYDVNGDPVAPGFSTINSTEPGISNSEDQSSSSSFSTVPISPVSSAVSSPSSIETIPSIIVHIYGVTYSISHNGQIIGTYTFSGGSGELNGANPNVLTVQLDPSYVPEEGGTLTLFTFAEGEGGFGDNLIVEGLDYECLEARGEETLQEYQIIFENASSCTTKASKVLASATYIINI